MIFHVPLCSWNNREKIRATISTLLVEIRFKGCTGIACQQSQNLASGSLMRVMHNTYRAESNICRGTLGNISDPKYLCECIYLVWYIRIKLILCSGLLNHYKITPACLMLLQSKYQGLKHLLVWNENVSCVEVELWPAIPEEDWLVKKFLPDCHITLNK